MTLFDVVSKLPYDTLVTIADYLKSDIYHTDTADRIVNFDTDKTLRDMLCCLVYKIEVGEVHGDLIVSIVKGE